MWTNRLFAFLLVAAGASLCAQPSVERMLRLYPVGERDTNRIFTFFSRFEKLSKRAATSDLRLAVELQSTFENRALPAKIVRLPWSVNTSDFSGPQGGWKQLRGSVAWIPGGTDEKLEIPFSTPDGQPLSLRDFDELWIDYDDGSRPSALLTRLNLESRDYISNAPRTPFRAVTGQAVSRPVGELPVADGYWQAKEQAYVLRRLLRLSPDARWRYAKWKKHTVLQQRLHRSLRNIDFLDLVMVPGTSVEGFNLRIAASNNNSPGVLFQLGGAPRMIPDSNGNWVWRIDIPALLSLQFADKRNFYLQEITILIRGGVSDILARRPVRKILFEALDYSIDRATTEPLRSRMERCSAASKRLMVDLHEMRYRGDVVLKDGALVIYPNDSAVPSSLKIEDIKLVKLKDVPVPKFSRSGEELIKRWGGPFLGSQLGGHGVEWPVIQGLFAFRKVNPLVGVNRWQQGFHFSGDKRVAAEPNDEPVTLLEREAVLRSDGSFSRAESDEGGLLLEGEGAWVETEFPLAARLGKDSRFFLDVPVGADQIELATLTARFQSGNVLQVAVEPNKAVALQKEGKLVGALLRLRVGKAPYQIKLKEAAFFTPIVASMEEAFNMPVPTVQSRRPEPLDFAFPQNVYAQARPGQVRGVVLGEAGRSVKIGWRTPLRGSDSFATAVRLSYSVPSSVQSHNPCWLSLVVVRDKSRVSRDVCFERPQGHVLLPLSRFVARDRLLDGADQVEWSARLDDAQAGDRVFEIEYSFDTLAMYSAADEFAAWPVAYVGDGRRLGLHYDEKATADILSKPVIVDADDHSVQLLAKGKGFVRPAPNELFQVKSVILQPAAWVQQRVWERLMAEDQPPPEPSRSPGAMLMLCLAFVGWRFRGTKPLQAPVGAVAAASRMLAAGVAGVLSDFLEANAPVLNLAVIALAVGPGCWMSGRMGWTRPGSMLLAACIVLACAGLWHRARLKRSFTWPWLLGKGDEAPPFLGVVVALMVVWTSWNVARMHSNISVAWNLLPVIACGYFFIAFVWRGFLNGMLSPGGGRSVALAALWFSAALLAGMAGWNFAGEDNYEPFFTLSCVFAALALRYALDADVLARRFPALMKDVFSGSGKPYFLASLVAIGLTAAALALQLRSFAEYPGVVSFLCLAIGAALEFFASKNDARV